MKKLFLASAMFACLTGYAQKDSSYLELGLNVFPILKTVQNGSSDLMINPYAFTAEFVVKSKVGIRTGVGFSSELAEELPSTTNGNTRFINDSSALDLRFGLFLNKKLGEKWTFKCGVDAIIEQQASSSNTVFTNANNERIETENSNEFRGFGFAPFVFAQYHLSKNFSVGTELSFRFLNGTQNEVVTSEVFPEFESETQKEITKNGILWPTALFLNIRF